MPFFPGAQADRLRRRRHVGRSSGSNSFPALERLDPSNPITWKRQNEFCGDAGVMNDLGLHTWHVPLRMGWVPARLYAVLQDLVPQRPGPDGTLVVCDTIENAEVIGTVEAEAGPFPLRVLTSASNRDRRTPGCCASSAWTAPSGFDRRAENAALSRARRGRAGVARGRASVADRAGREPIGVADRHGRHIRKRILGCHPADVGGVSAERAGALGDSFGCVTPREAWSTHRLYRAALTSHAEQAVVTPQW